LGKLRHLDTHTLWIQQAVRTGRISLRKVPGLANPADLLTKHSLSRERLHDLVRLYGCEYRPGRASLAPTLRRTQGTKTTLADHAAEDLTGEIEERVQDDGEDLLRPIMPHRLFGDEELDALYPAFNAPAEVDNPDAAKDEDDSTLQHGWKLASEICRDMQNYGRTRREAWHRPGVEPVASDSLSSHGVGVCLWSRGGPGDASGHQALPASASGLVDGRETLRDGPRVTRRDGYSSRSTGSTTTSVDDNPERAIPACVCI